MNDVKELTIFDYLNQVFIKKEDIMKEGDKFPFYMIQRWGSMHSTKMTLFLNECCNPKYKSISGSGLEYDFLKSITPKLNSVRWEYIKKNKTKEKIKGEKRITDEMYGLVAKKLEISIKDVKLIEEHDSELFSRLMKDTELLKGKKLE